jgi:5-methylcytosine-specific restriction endonuclease McrA
VFAPFDYLRKVSAQQLVPQFTLRAALAVAHPRSSGWRKARDAHLLLYPTCAACGIDDCLEVHHIVPFHEHPHLELDPENFITLCEHPGRWCHFREGHLFDWRGWNPYVVEDAAKALRRLLHRRR